MIDFKKKSQSKRVEVDKEMQSDSDEKAELKEEKKILEPLLLKIPLNMIEATRVDNEKKAEENISDKALEKEL